MIDLTINTDDLFKAKDQVFEEGISDAFANATGIDAGDVGKSWSNVKDVGDIGDALRTTNDKGLQPARDIADTLDTHVLNQNRVDNRSIVARARNSILQFPVYITQSCPVVPAKIISELFARYYTDIVRNALAQNPIMDEEEANNLVFLKKFHTNLRESAQDFLKGYENLFNPFYQPIDETDTMLRESVYSEYKITENCTLRFRVVPTTDTDLINENARLINEPLTGFDYLKEVEDRPIPTERVREVSAKYTTVTEEELREMAIKKAKLSEERRRVLDMTPQQIRAEAENRVRRVNNHPGQTINGRAVEHEVKHLVDQRDEALKRVNKELKKLKKDIKDGNIKGYSYDGVRYRRNDNSTKVTTRPAEKHPIDPAVDAPKILRDTDIKKINGMLPYSIEASFRLRTRSGIDRDVRYTLGIKCVLHMIRTQDLADDLQELITGKMKALQKVRYKTGEISFKDYLFNPKQLKADAAKHINYNKRWLNNLKRLSDYEQQYGSFLKIPIQALNKGDVPIPNATLVLTQPDVATLTNQTGIDLSQIDNARRLAKNLFLIGICIVDSSAGTLRIFLPDRDVDWDIQSIAAIDAEVAKTDNSQLMRELNHIVNR